MGSMATFSPHIAVDVLDREAAVDRFTDLLGMDRLEVTDAETVLQSGDVRFHVQEADEPRVYLEFSVADCEALADRLDAEGCTLSTVETPEGERSYLVDDPVGLHYHVY